MTIHRRLKEIESAHRFAVGLIERLQVEFGVLGVGESAALHLDSLRMLAERAKESFLGTHPEAKETPRALHLKG